MNLNEITDLDRFQRNCREIVNNLNYSYLTLPCRRSLYIETSPMICRALFFVPILFDDMVFAIVTIFGLFLPSFSKQNTQFLPLVSFNNPWTGHTSKSSLFYKKMKSCFDRCFPQQIRPQTTVQSYILRDCSSVRIGFNMINKRHTLPIVYAMLNPLNPSTIIVVLLRVKRSMW